jgi:protein-S-isoprenylcysteine O-methyltransferase Ste14
MTPPQKKRFFHDILVFSWYVLIAMAAWGNPRAFFASSARSAWAAIMVLTAIGTSLSESSPVNRGIRNVAGQGRELMLFEVASWMVIFIVSYCDYSNRFVFHDSTALRNAGLLLFTFGKIVRTWAIVYLGRYFSVFLTIQEQHRLVTENIYTWIRHPSYLGLLLIHLGTALVFRSKLGLLFWFLLLIWLVVRMNREERILASEFGSFWENYKSRSRRLIPGIY